MQKRSNAQSAKDIRSLVFFANADTGELDTDYDTPEAVKEHLADNAVGGKPLVELTFDFTPQSTAEINAVALSQEIGREYGRSPIIIVQLLLAAARWGAQNHKLVKQVLKKSAAQKS